MLTAKYFVGNGGAPALSGNYEEALFDEEVVWGGAPEWAAMRTLQNSLRIGPGDQIFIRA